MICEREDEIAAFVPQEYWTLDAEGEHGQSRFPLKLVEYRGTKVEQFSFTNEGSAREVEATLNAAARGTLAVETIDRKQRRRNPAPPFTTSTLQQEAARKLGFSAQRTMRLAQQLYEGVDYGEGAVGLITYMRTDSVSLAAEAVTEIRAVIEKLYGKQGLSEEIRVYKTKSKNAQEAHEAVRPTSAAITPSLVEGRIDNDQFRLYSLIWKRAVACQMAHAVFDTVAVDMRAGKAGAAAESHLFRANGSTLVSPGYIAVYQEGRDDTTDDDSDHVLPAMTEGDAVKLLSLVGVQHFTEPPPRYSEASLVKALEEYGIGRPSTYASIISTLKDREYVEMDGRRFIATDIGKIVARFLTTYFTEYVQYNFTADMEDELDAISRGEEPWVTPLRKFWKPFISLVDKIEKSVSREEVALARDLGIHPESGRPVSVRMGRFGAFVQAGTKDDEEKPKFAGLRAGSEDGHHHARPGAGALQAAARSRRNRRWREDDGRNRPLRSLHQVRREIRLAEGTGRSLRSDARARDRGDRSEEGRRRQPHHPGLRRHGHPGAERPLRPLHHRQGTQRAHPERSRPEVADARGMQGAARSRAAATGVRPLRPWREGQGEGQNRSQEQERDREGCGHRKGRCRRRAGAAESQGRQGESRAEEESEGQSESEVRRRAKSSRRHRACQAQGPRAQDRRGGVSCVAL